jgi:hypothetical protein
MIQHWYLKVDLKAVISEEQFRLAHSSMISFLSMIMGPQTTLSGSILELKIREKM